MPRRRRVKLSYKRILSDTLFSKKPLSSIQDIEISEGCKTLLKSTRDNKRQAIKNCHSKKKVENDAFIIFLFALSGRQLL